MEKRRPSRMTLSPKVSQAPQPRASPAGKPVTRRSNGPFGAMNVTETKITPHAPRRHPVESKSRYAPRSGSEKKRPEQFKALKMQRALTSVSYDKRSSVKQTLADRDSFSDFALLPKIQESIVPQALRGLPDVSPTPIQRLAIPALLNTAGKNGSKAAQGQDGMQQFLLAAETGSGKTLAYILPILDAIKRAEAREKEQEAQEERAKEASRRGSAMFELDSPPLSNEPHPTTGRPRAIILLPTAELVDQVGVLVKSLSHTVKFRAAMLSSSFSGPVIRNRLFSPSGIDIVVSTPHLLSSIVESDPNVVSRVTHLVVDEADSLFDRSFAPITGSILDRATPSLKQLILCSATIPRSLDSTLRTRYPDINRLTTPNLHAIPRRVQLSVVDVERDPYKNNKDLACADTIWNIGREANEEDNGTVRRMIVFVNEREKASELATYLQTKGIDAGALSRDSSERKKAEVLADFTGAVEQSEPKREPTKSLDTVTWPPMSATTPRRSLANVKILVMTDLGSRGIDTLAVRHVILYDVPHTSIDFIHRLGRVGRMGRRGRGVVLVGKGDRRDIVREVREGMFMGKALI